MRALHDGVLVSAVLAVAVLVVAATVAGTGGAAPSHTNDVHVDSQVVGDGTVLVEEAFPLDDAVLVLRLAEEGDAGPVLGERPLGPGPHNALEVPLDDPERIDGVTRLRATLYLDENRNGEYDPGADPPLRSFGEVVADEFSVRRADRSVRLVADDSFGPVQLGETLRVPLVEVADSGHVAVHADDGGAPGRVLGVASVAPGVTENLTVRLGDRPPTLEDGTTRLWAVVYADDGDGEFDRSSDRPVTVGEDPVASWVPVVVNGSSVGGETTTGESTTADEGTTTGESTTAEGGTPTPGNAASDGDEDGEEDPTTGNAEATSESTGGGTGDGMTGAGSAGSTADDGASGGIGGPTDGFGAPTAAIAVVAALAVLALVGRRRG